MLDKLYSGKGHWIHRIIGFIRSGIKLHVETFFCENIYNSLNDIRNVTDDKHATILTLYLPFLVVIYFLAVHNGLTN